VDFIDSDSWGSAAKVRKVSRSGHFDSVELAPEDMGIVLTVTAFQINAKRREFPWAL
jgi:hypothetical protein